MQTETEHTGLQKSMRLLSVSDSTQYLTKTEYPRLLKPHEIFFKNSLNF